LHPRNLAIGAVVFGLTAALEQRPTAFAWIVAAIAIHPTIGVCGAFHAVMQWWRPPRNNGSVRSEAVSGSAAPILLAPPFFASLLPRSTPVWRALIESRRYLFLLRWHWYEWLGVVAPLVLLELFASISRHDSDRVAAHIARRAAIAGFLATVGSVVIMLIPALLPVVAAEPMRAFQIVYLLFVLIGGGLIGKHILRKNRLRWVVFVLFFVAAFYFADRVEYPASEHIEWPGAVSRNPWPEAFEWIRGHAPQYAYFAVDPLYTQKDGEDVHGFRALAVRSVLADDLKDQSVAQVDSELAGPWKQQTDATQAWQKFGVADFERIEKMFGVNWLVLDLRENSAGTLDCPFKNVRIAVCKLR